MPPKQKIAAFMAAVRVASGTAFRASRIASPLSSPPAIIQARPPVRASRFINASVTKGYSVFARVGCAFEEAVVAQFDGLGAADRACCAGDVVA